jgi:hypothetical protein
LKNEWEMEKINSAFECLNLVGRNEITVENSEFVFLAPLVQRNRTPQGGNFFLFEEENDWSWSFGNCSFLKKNLNFIYFLRAKSFRSFQALCIQRKLGARRPSARMKL